MNRTIALSGELGSGKSSVSERLAGMLHARRVSTGAAQRQIAELRGVTTLELNRMAETDPKIDEEIDSVFRSLASEREALVVDSRLAWHFLPGSFKVHLVVDPVEAARRVLRRTGSAAERYRSLEEAVTLMGQRVESEQRRFHDVYGVDIFRLRNYDLVVDTSEAANDEVVAAILDALAGRVPVATAPALLLAPTRVHPTTGPRGDAEPPVPAEGAGDPGQGYLGLPPIEVGYSRPHFFVVDGHRRLSAAIGAGLPLLPATLLAEDGEPVAGGPAADDYPAG